MPRFHWKGRSADGRDVEGDLDAASKEEVVTRLRGSRILVSSVMAGGEGPLDAGASLPVDSRLLPAAGEPESLVDRVARERATQKPRRLRGVLVALAFLAGAAVIGCFLPITTYHCDRADGETVSCTLSERALGLVTLREGTLSRVASVGYETIWIDGRDERGRPTRTASKRLQLKSASGATLSPTYWDRGGSGKRGFGATNSTVDSAISNLIRGGITGPVHLWQGEWPLLFLAGPLVAIGLLMLLLAVLSLFKGPTDVIYGAAGALAASADAKRRRQGH